MESSTRPGRASSIILITAILLTSGCAAPFDQREQQQLSDILSRIIEAQNESYRLARLGADRFRSSEQKLADTRAAYGRVATSGNTLIDRVTAAIRMEDIYKADLADKAAKLSGRYMTLKMIVEPEQLESQSLLGGDGGVSQIVRILMEISLDVWEIREEEIDEERTQWIDEFDDNRWKPWPAVVSEGS